ncbi:MAG: class I SAM-dependent methyltransferase [Bacillota bacterium]
MNREALTEKVRQLGPWFHQIDVGEGVFTRSVAPLPGPQPVDHPIPRWNKIKDMLPQDMRGMRIFDIGCSDGLFSIEMHRRGAKSILSMDADKGSINRLKWLKKQMKLDSVDPQVGDIYKLDKGIGKFDFVFMFALLYHLKDPLGGLEKLAPLSDILCLETITVADRSEKRSFLAFRPPKEGVNVNPKWIPTPQCIVDMLHWVGFQNVVLLSDLVDNRPIYLAYKNGADLSRWKLPAH